MPTRSAAQQPGVCLAAIPAQRSPSDTEPPDTAGANPAEEFLKGLLNSAGHKMHRERTESLGPSATRRLLKGAGKLEAPYLAGTGPGTCQVRFLANSGLGMDSELWARVCWPQQGLGRGWVHAVGHRQLLQQRGSGSSWGQQSSASLVLREAEGDTGASAGQLKLLPSPARSRADVTSGRSSMPHGRS